MSRIGKLPIKVPTGVEITQNGLNLMGVTPYAFKMVIGFIILIAISTSNINLNLKGFLFSKNQKI